MRYRNLTGNRSNEKMIRNRNAVYACETAGRGIPPRPGAPQPAPGGPQPAPRPGNPQPAPDGPQPVPRPGNPQPAPDGPQPVPRPGNPQPAPDGPQPAPRPGNLQPMPRRKPTVCRSAFMSAAEIEQEREQSGWNPYVGEEEGEINEEIKEPLPGTEFAQTDCPVPYAGYVQMEEWLKEDKKEAQDLRRLQTLYPAAAKQLLPYIEEVCDQMEYSGSMMFDEYPDSETMFRLQEDLLSRMKEESEAQTKAGSRTQPEMPSLVPEASPAGAEPLQELTRVLLLQEMHRRRSRHRRILAVSG